VSHQWGKYHVRAILSAYGKSPFYEYFADDFLNIINKKHRFLFDLNMEILLKCFEFLDIHPNIDFTKKYEKELTSDVLDSRELIDLKKPNKRKLFFQPTPYYQVFGINFKENMSIIDLLFCEGPNAMHIIRQSAKPK